MTNYSTRFRTRSKTKIEAKIPIKINSQETLKIKEISVDGCFYLCIGVADMSISKRSRDIAHVKDSLTKRIIILILYINDKKKKMLEL